MASSSSTKKGIVFGSEFGRTKVTLYDRHDIIRAYHHPDLVRGFTPEGLLPGVLMGVMHWIFQSDDKTDTFFGALERGDPRRDPRAVYTRARMGPASAADGARIADLLKAGRTEAALHATCHVVLGRFSGADGFVPDADGALSPDVMADVDAVQAFTTPSWRWASPYHHCVVPAARTRLITALGGQEGLHHVATACAFFRKVLAPLADPEMGRRLVAAGPKGTPLLDLFRGILPDVYRVVKVAPGTTTTLGGMLPRPVGNGTLVGLHLQEADAREMRFFECCAQAFITTLAKHVAQALWPGAVLNLPPVRETAGETVLPPAVSADFRRIEEGPQCAPRI